DALNLLPFLRSPGGDERSEMLRFGQQGHGGPMCLGELIHQHLLECVSGRGGPRRRVAFAGFFAVQRFGGAKLVDRALMALAEKLGWSSLANLANLHDNLVRIYADVPRFAVAILVHLIVWFVGVLEVLVALHFMGYPVSYADALVIESLGQAVRAAAFLVPGALGVQEAAFI